MSHGSTDKCEPNLIPLLDLVLQLVMFFMVCANFVMEQINETIKLPSAKRCQAAGPEATNIIFLNVNEKGEVLLSALDAVGKENTLYNKVQVQNYMKRRSMRRSARTAATRTGRRNHAHHSGGQADAVREGYDIMKAQMAGLSELPIAGPAL